MTLPAAEIAKYIDTIFSNGDAGVPNLECPKLNETRYLPLVKKPKAQNEIQYFFALNLRTNMDPLPRLLGSIVEAVKFLGPANCMLSIVEGHSKDGTPDILKAIRPSLEALGLRYSYERSEIDPGQGDRIQKLAQLRNAALQPLFNLEAHASKDTTILFVNDVTACPEDILELALQRKNLGADMTCAMDWTYVGEHPTFYDIWVARTITGDLFFEIPPDGNWNSAWNLFWNEDHTRGRWSTQRPFQVFACWDGATALRAKPFLDGLRFRGPKEGECYQGEPELICKDLWLRGYGKIAVVPSISLEYTIKAGRKIKKLKGFTSDVVSSQDLGGDKIEWKLEAPEKVKCMPELKNQSWRPWNEGFENVAISG